MVNSGGVEVARFVVAVVGRGHLLSRFDERLLQFSKDVLSVRELSQCLKWEQSVTRRVHRADGKTEKACAVKDKMT